MNQGKNFNNSSGTGGRRASSPNAFRVPGLHPVDKNEKCQETETEAELAVTVNKNFTRPRRASLQHNPGPEHSTV